MFVLVQMLEEGSEWIVDMVFGTFDTREHAQMFAEQQAFLWMDDPDDDSVYRWIVKELH